jgi:UDP-N-acetylmuramate: L-alanyl-gamma-D-glutamyl-meso-diaminopimelate ligase
MELHTFSSLMADFLPQYNGCMQESDTAFVYFNPKVIEHKHLTPISADEVAKAFATPNIRVFTDSQALADALRQTVTPESTKKQGTALLMMTSGTFDGINIKEFARELLGA